MSREWTDGDLLELARGYQAPSVLLAAAEVDLVSQLVERPLSAEELAAVLGADVRATRILADAMVALELLEKRAGHYRPAPGTVETLTATGDRSIMSMLRHQASCMRSWSQLGAAVIAGHPVDVTSSIHGPDDDYAAFIRAMHVASREAAPMVVEALAPLSFRRLLDVGGGPGTWTIAFLRAAPRAHATIYDLPQTLPIAREHLEAAGLEDRVDLVAGDFYTDPELPPGADLAWVSAIVHQSSRRENRGLFAKVHAALEPDGEIMVRDMVMDEEHVRPTAGALFAVNMLVRTETGATYSFAELAEDLVRAGFEEPTLVRGERPMDSVLRARKS